MRGLFAEVRRVLADDGTLWLNLGDSYSATTVGHSGSPSKTLGAGWNPASDAAVAAAHERHRFKERQVSPGVPPKNLLGIPWRVTFALQDDGWILRNAIVWRKTNPMPSSATDRLTTTYEFVFLFSKAQRYWFDLDAIRRPHAEKTLRDFGDGSSNGKAYGNAKVPDNNWEPAGNQRRIDPRGVNPGDVWDIATQPYSEVHFAVFPPELPGRCILAGCKPGGTVLDPFSGSGTTGLAATKHGRRYVGIDLNADYLDLSLRTRLQQGALIADEDGAS